MNSFPRSNVSLPGSLFCLKFGLVDFSWRFWLARSALVGES
jgi:hypothetical protein